MFCNPFLQSIFAIHFCKRRNGGEMAATRRRNPANWQNLGYHGQFSTYKSGPLCESTVWGNRMHFTHRTNLCITHTTHLNMCIYNTSGKCKRSRCKRQVQAASASGHAASANESNTHPSLDIRWLNKKRTRAKTTAR